MGVTVRQRSGSWNVFWPYGGGRSTAGRTQSTTWSDEPTARQAAALVRARHQNITDTEVEELILGKVDLPAEALSPCPTLRAWFTEWMPSRTRPAPSWRATAESMWQRRILPFTPAGGIPLGDRPMDLITGVHVGQLVHDLRVTSTPQAPNGLRETTITRYLSELNAAYAAAIRAQRITHVTINPCRESDFRRDQVAHDDDGSGDHEPVYLTPAQYRRLRDQFHPHYHPLLDVLVGTGQRWSEATAMAVAAVELAPRHGDGPQVRVTRAWKKGKHGRGDRYLGPTKGKKARTVPISAMLLPAVKGLADGRGPKGFLLVGPGGKPYEYANFYHQVWRPAVVRAARCEKHPPADRGGPVPAGEADRGALCGDWGGMKEDRGRPVKPCGAKRAAGMTRCRWHLGPPPDAASDCGCPHLVPAHTGIHDLRHTYASWYLAGGGDIRRLQDLLGHESITTTEIYSGLLPGGDHRVVAALDTVWATG